MRKQKKREWKARKSSRKKCGGDVNIKIRYYFGEMFERHICFTLHVKEWQCPTPTTNLLSQ